jgi:hypothetical protein
MHDTAVHWQVGLWQACPTNRPLTSAQCTTASLAALFSVSMTNVPFLVKIVGMLLAGAMAVLSLKTTCTST